MERTCLAIILAAGDSTRMKSSMSKVLHPIAGRPMIAHVMEAIAKTDISAAALVVGRNADEVSVAASIGGIAVETVTEDAHTSLRMQMNGWNTAYINLPQAAGLATERLSGHVKQRIRWARGMIQILRTDNPLFAKGLGAAQRLCYFNAMTHFLYALPRLIFLTAPLIYLILGQVNVPGYWAAILAYALPHLFLSSITNSRIQGSHCAMMRSHR